MSLPGSWGYARAGTLSFLFGCLVLGCAVGQAAPAGADGFVPLFDGETLDGWRASEQAQTWRVEDGCLVAHGPRSHLFYQGPVGDHDFRNFDLIVEAKTAPGANSGVYFHTAWQDSGWPRQGYEVQICNANRDDGGAYRELKRTGSLYGVRNIYKASAADGEWFTLRIRVMGNRVRIWINGHPTVDYLEPDEPIRQNPQMQRRLGSGTIALQAHDPQSQVAFRTVKLRVLPDDAPPLADPRTSEAGYGLEENLIDRLASRDIPMIDFHVHLRGGMTAEKALARQAVTGVNLGVLRNIGRGWPIETDAQLRAFLDSVDGMPLFVGLQVNDRDWMERFDADLLARLDYVLADTMIMPMPDDESDPVKLWMPELYEIDDPQRWMDRYMRHNLRVLSEPITILANPTYLPPPVEHLYGELWTDQRMRQIIQAAIDNDVALEINADSGLPHERFIRLAKRMGAKFSFGTNNFDDRPISLRRCFEAIERYELTKNDLYAPSAK